MGRPKPKSTKLESKGRRSGQPRPNGGPPLLAPHYRGATGKWGQIFIAIFCYEPPCRLNAKPLIARLPRISNLNHLDLD